MSSEAIKLVELLQVLHDLLLQRMSTLREVELAFRDRFPDASVSWMTTHFFEGEVLRLSFRDRPEQTIAGFVDNGQLVECSLTFHTTHGDEARDLGKALASELTAFCGLAPEVVFPGESGSYSWQLPDIDIELAVHGEGSLAPHGVLTTLGSRRAGD